MKGKQLGLFEAARKGSEVARFEAAPPPEDKVRAAAAGLTPEAERLLGNFEVVAGAPGGVKRLRDLILSLAIRGKLVPQQPSDGTPAKVLELVEAKRQRLTAEGKAGRSESVPEVERSAAPFEIPAGWMWAQFARFTVCRDGQRIPVSKEERQGRRGPYDYYGASGVIDTIDGYIFDEPLLLIGEDGANLVNRSTPIAFMATGKYWVNNHAHVLDGAHVDSLRYLSIFINAIDLHPYVTGTAQPKMNQAKMNSIPIAVPPLAEQKRIVAKVDDLMKLCDDLEARQAKQRETAGRLNKAALHALTTAEGPEELAAGWRQVAGNFEALVDRPESLKELRQAILHLAVMGTLVRQDPMDSHPGPWLAEMRSRRDRYIESNNVRVYTSKKSVQPFPIPWSLPPNWEITTWGATSEWITYGFTRPMPHVDRGVPIVTGKNVTGSAVDLSSADYTTEEAFESLSEKDRPRPGDILITKDGSIGRAAVVGHGARFCINQSVAVAWLRTCEMDRRFLLLLIESPLIQGFIASRAEGAAIKHLSVVDFAQMPVLVPPLAEQKRIVAKVDHLMKLCDALEAALRRAEDTSQRLTDALVAELLT